jgi:hypothetical protein
MPLPSSVPAEGPVIDPRTGKRVYRKSEKKTHGRPARSHPYKSARSYPCIEPLCNNRVGVSGACCSGLHSFGALPFSPSELAELKTTLEQYMKKRLLIRRLSGYGTVTKERYQEMLNILSSRVADAVGTCLNDDFNQVHYAILNLLLCRDHEGNREQLIGGFMNIVSTIDVTEEGESSPSTPSSAL